jgi:hypothetical protein
VQGKVTVRDSIGAGRTWEDFSVRFVQLGDGLEARHESGELKGQNMQLHNSENVPDHPKRPLRTGGDIEQIENLVDRHLTYAESIASNIPEDYMNFKDDRDPTTMAVSPFYTLYLRRLLSAIPLSPHETFAHPVACVIAISSRNTSPIDALRRLYDDSTRGEKRLPAWVHGEYLRYYVLVHDEERDDIGKSMALFEQMKRHFGLHCHLLRLRSTQCVPTDDDSTFLPSCEWVSAAEELARIDAIDAHEDVEDATACIFESDATALRTFIREMVTQSVIPSMERCISTWNDQVASRRRGLSGRFISLSKRWTGFGSSSRNSTGASAVSGNSSNYDQSQGFYRPDAPEAVMRKLADYAFMLRDWKLAQSTYDLLRSDFSNDKAWRYHAAANEMAALSTLLGSPALSSKTRAETVDQMLETAAYSYVTRCGSQYGALRSLALGMELLRIRGGSATDDAARWGTRIVEQQMGGKVGGALFRERIAACYSSRTGTGSGGWGSRTRKSALWTILAAESWVEQKKMVQAKRKLDEVSKAYATLKGGESITSYSAANAFLAGLQQEIIALGGSNVLSSQQTFGETDLPVSLDVEEESEALDGRSHRRSLIGAHVPTITELETAPLSPLTPEAKNSHFVDEGFE